MYNELEEMCLVWGTMLVSAWRNQEEPWENSVETASVLGGIQIGHLRNTSHKCYCMSNLPSLTNMGVTALAEYNKKVIM